MAKLLYRLAHAARRRRGLVLGIWLLVLAIAGIGALGFAGQTTNQFSIPGTESQRALDHLKDKLPQAAGASGRIVFAAPPGRTLDESKQAIDAAITQVGKTDQVSGAFSPFVTKAIGDGGRIGLAQVQFSVSPPEVKEETKAAIKSAVDAVGTSTGLEVAYSQEIAGEMVAIGATEGIGVVIAAIVLVLTFGSLVAAGLPMLTALVGVGIGVGGLYALTSVIDMSSTAPVLALMLGLAVGIDYALFIVHRHRKQVLGGMDVTESIARAIGTAGSAVFFAGLTVIIALVGLTVVGIPFLSVMGLAAAATVAVAVLIALTLVPAILGYVGDRIVSDKARAKDADPDRREAFGYRWGRAVSRRPITALVLIVVSLGAIAIPAFSLEMGLPDDSTAQEGSPQQRANALVTQAFGPGFSGPLVVVADLPSGVDPEQAVGALVGKLNSVKDVTRVVPAGLSLDKTAAVLQVIPGSGPSTEATKDLVSRLRELTGEVKAQTGSSIGVTGQTALNIDVSQKLSDALPTYLIVIVGLSLILLAIMFRSILVPIKATAGFLLTVAASIGAVVAIFQWGWLGDLLGLSHGSPIISFLPILMTGILFGLAMDYEVFLVSGMREAYVHGDTPRDAVVDGLGHSARVVTAAALIMTAVFLGFVFSHDTVIKSMGFALAFGVMVDAFVIRMTLVPALMTLFGKAAWWYPKSLDRITPNVDVEGETLARHIGQRDQREKVPQPV
nr:MMPL family transporter [Kibdelosporangium sp. MJ126-NF4]CEL23512.1 putative drug exporters of the RND superfamily [Kibdelosporangium sp. MJ126-NF4]CTQ89126.1 putative drug exporters of the RND superfamily [Kibdelosporangium sp. MJ126-NF4]